MTGSDPRPHPSAPPAAATPDGGTPEAVTPEAVTPAVVTPAVVTPEAGSAEPPWAPDPGDWLDDDALEPPRRGFRPPAFAMRHPVLLVAIIIGAGFMALQSWPAVHLMWAARTPGDCGDLTERPVLRHTAPEQLPPLRHDTWCTLQGVVESRTIYATGEAQETSDPRKRHAGRKYFLKLNGENVFAIVAADRPEVVEYRLRKGSLVGFEITGPGRLIEPSTDGGYQNTERFLRTRFAARVAPDRPVWLYDTTDDPNRRWPHILVVLLMTFTAGLALFGLVRLYRQRREDSEAPSVS